MKGKSWWRTERTLGEGQVMVEDRDRVLGEGQVMVEDRENVG